MAFLTVPDCIVLHWTERTCIVCTALHSTVLQQCTLLHYTVLQCTLLHIVLHWTLLNSRLDMFDMDLFREARSTPSCQLPAAAQFILFNCNCLATVLHCAVLHCAELHCNRLHCTSSHCTVLQVWLWKLNHSKKAKLKLKTLLIGFRVA